MKKQLIIYMILIVGFIAYNQFFPAQDPKTNALINIIFASFLFLYIGYLSFMLLKKIKNNTKK